MIALPPRIRDTTRQLSATRDAPLARDLAMLGARVALAWVFIYHGARTLFGAFGGPGIHQAAVFFGTVAHLHPATFFATLSGIVEFFGGLGLAFGILGRLAAAGLVGDMVIAMITVTFGNGIAANAPHPGGGYELNLALAGLAFVVAILGTGRFSLDAVIRTRLMGDAGSLPPSAETVPPRRPG